MKFKDYLEQINAFAKKYPEALDFEVITADDEEGNGYTPVYYGPSMGEFNKAERQFTNDVDEEKYNAVCLN